MVAALFKKSDERLPLSTNPLSYQQKPVIDLLWFGWANNLH